MAVLLLLLCGAAASAQDKSWEGDGFILKWSILDNTLVMTLSGETTGWISVGFAPTRMMKDADIIILAVDDKGTATAQDHYGTSPTSHKRDTDLGGTDNVSVIGGKESGGWTTVTFSIPLDSGDSRDKILAPGQKVRILVASSSKDSFRTRHNRKGKGEITL